MGMVNTMSFEFIKKLPTPAEIREEYPLPPQLAKIKEERDAEIRDVITGKSNKFLVIIGPCSADNEDSVCDYRAASSCRRRRAGSQNRCSTPRRRSGRCR